MESRPIKLHSARAIAAHVYHGWTLGGVIVDPESNQLGESFLVWNLPETLRRPDELEIGRFEQLFVVEDAFTIADRGTVISPGIPREPHFEVKQGELIVLICPQTQKAFTAEIKSIEMLFPSSPKGWPIQISSEITKQDVPAGTLVWSRRAQGKEEANKLCVATPSPPPI